MGGMAQVRLLPQVGVRGGAQPTLPTTSNSSVRLLFNQGTGHQ